MNYRNPVTVVAIALMVIPACKKPEEGQRQAAPSVGATPATPSIGAPPTTPASTGSNPPLDKPSAPALPQITKWELDPENSSVNFVSKHAAFTNVRGMFQRPSGTIVLDEATPTNSKVNATIDVKSITTGVDERDTHLKSPDFFDATKYPVITFASTRFTKLSDTSYSVTGSLTMHGATKPVTLAITASPPFRHFGTIRRGIEATTSVNRTDFGVGVAAWNTPDENGNLLVGNNVTITIDAELVLQPKPGQGG